MWDAIRTLLLRQLASRVGAASAHSLLARLAERLGVEEVVVAGRLGRIEGRLDDAMVFGSYLRTGTWSPELVAFLERCFEGRGGGTFLDIGANIGLVSVPVARLGGVDCHCFEPDPENAELLRRNLARNCPAGRWEVFPIALYREETTLDLELGRGNRGDHRIRGARPARGPELYAEGSREVIRVAARRLDAVVDAAALRPPVVVKCDAQGAELDIYTGGAATFARADALALEFWPYGLARLGSSPDELIERVVKDFDRGLFVLGPGEIRREAFVPIAAVAERLRRFCREARPGEHADVVAVKEGPAA